MRLDFGKKLVVALALACVLLVSGLGYMYLAGTGRAERNLVGVISVEGAIISSRAAGEVAAAINQAMFNASVKAVVIRIDSPGGYAHLVEQIYLDVLELKKHKPVVASVATALSGGYYIAVAADRIYAHPTSMVGNVGVIGTGPPTLIPSERVLETGPYKATGFSRLLFPFNLSHALDSFASAVENGRGSRLRLSSTELKRGMIYMGSEAVAAGLADELGSLQTAAARAAEEAGLVDYRVVDISPAGGARGLSTAASNETEVAWREITVETLNRLNPPPAVYYLYLPSAAYVQSLTPLVQAEESAEDSAAAGAVGRGGVVVDLSHGNRVSSWVFDLLSAELAMRGVAVGYADTWDELKSSLPSAACLIIAAPTQAYSPEEFKVIDEFVGKGRLLLMFFDPAAEYVDSSALLGPINSLANRYGLSFGKGYLYSEGEHYGLYRNIYVRQFANTSLTRGLDAAVLFTATYLHHTDSDAAWTLGDAYSSVAEQRDSYAPISVIEGGNGTVAAFGDLTFLMEPYVYVEDNYRLVMNLVSAIAEIEVPEEEVEAPEYNVTEPELPVGTEKLYMEQIDGDEHELRWTRVGENETLVERPDRTTRYHFDVNDSLVRWESDGMAAAYDTPLPDLPYPLVEGKGWAYASGYNLTADGRTYRGRLSVKEHVVGFEEVEAGDGTRYLCAKVRSVEQDQLDRDGTNITAATTAYMWVSSEAGLVKDESETLYYVDGVLAKEETRSLILTSIQKGAG